VALVFLLAMSLLGVAAVMSTTTQERMARIDRDHTIALQSAETALRDAELDVRLSLSASPYTSGGATRSMAPNAPGATHFSCACGTDVATVQRGLCLPATLATACTANPWESATFWSSNASVPLHTFTRSATGTTDLPANSTYANGTSQAPRYMIEIIPNTDNANCSAAAGLAGGGGGPPCLSVRYRLTARGWGPNGTYATVQEAFQP
jgi:type IV pilus assembly protein PilX